MIRDIAFGVILSLLPTIAFAAEPIIGRASVIDGDTIEIADTRIRFNGVDAPESRQHCKNSAGTDYLCGKEAAGALDVFLAESRPTRCEPLNKDRYGRTVADCFRADNKSVQEWLVRNG